jgi:CubicO group peptidase (beta-lactamase class C family)
VDYLPELRQVHDPYGKLDSITLRMLLSHSAGFMNPTWPYDDGRPWEPFEPTTWQQLVAMMPYQQLEFEPGSRYGYSNPAFIYLARIIEQLTGDPWESYVRKNLFLPLGLHLSYFRTTPYHLAVFRSHNYSVRPGPDDEPVLTDHGADFDPGITTPNGGWNAPVDDLVRWVAFLTDSGGRENYDLVLSRGSLMEMWQPVVPMADGYEASPARFMGLSFFLIGPETDRVIGHTGSQANFRAFLYFNPRTTAAVIGVYNTTNYRAPPERADRVQEAAIALIR